ncbi:MAG: ankyrin repeat domain-containing protein [Pirellulaceae bacterium]
MFTAVTCPCCGASRKGLAPDAACPVCLIRLGISSEPGDPWEAADRGKVDSPLAGPAKSPWCPPTIEQLAPRFPELEILRLLGYGGMGAVYQTRQRSLDRFVALKIIRPDSAGEQSFADRFTREARLLARLNHPAIVAVYDFGERTGLYYLLMEYVEGVNLRAMMASGKLAATQALAIVPPLCEALQYAHEEGVIHRDIKPENILIDRRGRVKVADFGLAKLTGSHPAPTALTGTEQVMGTPHYMAPEQMQGARHVDHRADIYSLGVVFYELLTGELPFGRFEPPSHHVAVDVRLDDVVLRTLERDPLRRYQHAVDVKSDLESIGGEAVGGPAAITPPPVIPRKEPFEPILTNAPKSPVGPAIAMIVAGGCQIVVSICVALVLLHLARQERATIALLVLGGTGCGLLGMLFGSLAILGGVFLLRWQALGLVRVAACGLLIPTGPSWLLGLPAGMWALLTLARAHRTPPASRPTTTAVNLDPPRRKAGWRMALGLTLLATVLVVMYSRGHSSLLASAREGNRRAVRWSLMWGASVEMRDAVGMTPLMWAVWNGHRDVVEQLLQAGAFPDSVTIHGETALMQAAFRGDERMVDRLIAVGAEVNRRDEDGESSLLRAAANGHTRVVDRLLGAGANIDLASNTGWTPLMAASLHGHAETVRLLAHRGAHIHSKTIDDQTALMLAAGAGRSVAVSVLLDNRAMVDEQCVRGETALFRAAQSGHTAVVRLLLERAADPNLATRHGVGPLSVAAAGGHASIVQQLLAAGAKTTASDSDGRTPLAAAVARGQTAAVDVLLAAGAAEESCFWLWRGYQLARQARFAEALPWLEQAAGSIPPSPAMWTFQIDDWLYEVPAPGLFAWSAVAEVRQRLGHPTAPEAWRTAQQYIRADQPNLILLLRTQTLPDRLTRLTYTIVPHVVQQQMDDPAHPLEVRVSYHEEFHSAGRHSVRSGVNQAQRSSLFE